MAIIVKRDLIVNRVEDLTPAIGELKQALAEELVSRGVSPTFIHEPDNTPSAELNVVEWDPGSRALRALTAMAGEAHMTIVVRSPSADGTPGFGGTARGHVSGGFCGGSAIPAAREAALLIARAIATGIAK